MFCLKANKIEMARCLINTLGVDLDMVDRNGKYLEAIARENNLTDMLDLLSTFTGPRLRMIQEDSLLSRQSGTMSSLQSLSRDVVLTSLITNNNQKRKVESLLDGLGLRTWQAREMLPTIAWKRCPCRVLLLWNQRRIERSAPGCRSRWHNSP